MLHTEAKSATAGLINTPGLRCQSFRMGMPVPTYHTNRRVRRELAVTAGIAGSLWMRVGGRGTAECGRKARIGSAAATAGGGSSVDTTTVTIAATYRNTSGACGYAITS